MSDLTEEQLEQIKKQSARREKERLRKIRHDVRIAVQTQSTVPYDLRTLIEVGIGVDTIRKVCRP